MLKNQNKVTIKEFTTAVDDYLAKCKDKEITPFIAELANQLMISQNTLKRYRQKPLYGDAIKRVELATEASLLRHLIDDNKPVGAIFLLKALFRYRDVASVDVTTDGKPMGVVMLPQP